MIKITKNVNRDSVEFDTVDIGELTKVSWKMFDQNEDNYSQGNYFGQCQQCGKGIKNYKDSYTIICNSNTEIIVRRSHNEISEKSGGHMDYFDLGPECGRRVKKALKEIGEDWKDWIGHRTNNKELSKTEFQADNKIQVSAGKSTNNNPELKTKNDK